jgi:hypothetical protein
MTRHGTFFNAKCVQKWTAMALFLTLLNPFKNDICILWTQTNQKTCTFLTDAKKIVFYGLCCNESSVKNWTTLYLMLDEKTANT